MTQSRELAHYWAKQAVRERSVRIEGDESPVVFSVSLPEEFSLKVRPDVGAASLLMVKEGEAYIACLAKLYQDSNVGILDIDLKKADRLEYLNKLGMAYIDKDLSPEWLALLTD